MQPVRALLSCLPGVQLLHSNPPAPYSRGPHGTQSLAPVSFAEDGRVTAGHFLHFMPSDECHPTEHGEQADLSGTDAFFGGVDPDHAWLIGSEPGSHTAQRRPVLL